MSNALTSRSRLVRIVAVAISVWLGPGPIISAAPWQGDDHDCCCGSGSVCLLGGCDCGEGGTGDDSPCGGLRPAKDVNDAAIALSFVRDQGVSAQDSSGIILEIVGCSILNTVSFTEAALPALEPPPPRSASAC
jgi:hypothetical protein